MNIKQCMHLNDLCEQALADLLLITHYLEEAGMLTTKAAKEVVSEMGADHMSNELSNNSQKSAGWSIET